MDFQHHLSNRKSPPNAVAAARARQSTGKMFYPPVNAMNDVERFRLSTRNHSDEEDDDDEGAGIYDV